MDELKKASADARVFNLELFIAKFLRYGVLVAGLFIFIGWMSQIDFHHDVFTHFMTYTDNPLASVIPRLFAEHNWGLLTAYFGLLLLIALPLTRVALVAIVFLSEHDFAMSGCALLVLLGLALSFALGYEI